MVHRVTTFCISTQLHQMTGCIGSNFVLISHTLIGTCISNRKWKNIETRARLNGCTADSGKN